MSLITDSQSDFKIKFEGKKHEVDATVLITNLIQVSNIIQELNRELNTDRKIEVVIKALKQGSFLIHIELNESLIEGIKTFFSNEHVQYGGALVGGLVSIIELVKFLKSGKPDTITNNGNQTTIKNTKGDVIKIDTVVYNIYNSNQKIKSSVSNNFRALEADPNITGFQITDSNENVLVKVDKDEFKQISEIDSVSEKAEEEEDRVITEKVNLVILRPSFDESLKWDLSYRGSKKAVKIMDAVFLSSIEQGEPFSKGDVLECELQITQSYDSSIDAYKDKSFSVSKVYLHIKRDKQSSLDFD